MLAHHIKAHGHARTHTAAFHLELGVMRRDLHDSPEIGFEERHTAQRVVESLWVCDVDEIQTGFGRTGAVALIHDKGRGRGQMMRLRADADALIITEQNEVAWKSTWPGLMADRKHDGHLHRRAKHRLALRARSRQRCDQPVCHAGGRQQMRLLCGAEQGDAGAGPDGETLVRGVLGLGIGAGRLGPGESRTQIPGHHQYRGRGPICRRRGAKTRRTQPDEPSHGPEHGW